MLLSSKASFFLCFLISGLNVRVRVRARKLHLGRARDRLRVRASVRFKAGVIIRGSQKG